MDDPTPNGDDPQESTDPATTDSSGSDTEAGDPEAESSTDEDGERDGAADASAQATTERASDGDGDPPVESAEVEAEDAAETSDEAAGENDAAADEPDTHTLDPEVLEQLDPSIVKLPIFHDQPEDVREPLFLWHYRGLATQAKHDFWQLFEARRDDRRLRGEWLPRNPFVSTVEPLELRDPMMLLPEERIEELESHQSIDIETKKVVVPWAVTEQMQECSPQFTLRNIMRMERSDTVERGIRLDHEPPAIADANKELDDVRETSVPKAEMLTSWSAPLIEDFQVFLEEVLYLCPWGQMPRARDVPDEDSLWHPSKSHAELTGELLQRQHTVFVFGHRGGPRAFSREEKERVYTAREASESGDDGPQQSFGPPPGAQSFGPPPGAQSFGPPSDDDDDRMG